MASLAESAISKGYTLEQFRELLAMEESRAQADEKRELRRYDREMKKAALDLEKKKLDMEEAQLSRRRPIEANDKVSSPQIKLSKFQESDDIDTFLQTFERLARMYKWPEESWAARLIPLLTGKAQEAYNRLTEAEGAKYSEVKRVILTRYELTAETYRTKLRSAKQNQDETCSEFKCRVDRYMRRWCEMEGIGGDFNLFQDLLLREQLMNSSQRELQVWLREQKPTTVEELTQKAESYQDAHRQRGTGYNAGYRQKQCSDQRTKFNRQYLPKPSVPNPKFSGRGGTGGYGGGSQREAKCYICDRKDHFMKDCPLKRRLGNDHNKNALCVDKSPSLIGFGTLGGIKVVNLLGENGLNVERGTVEGVDVSVLRDTGSTSVYVARHLVPEYQLTGNKRTFTLADGGKKEAQEAWIEVVTPYVTGKVLAILLDQPFVDLLIDNQIHLDVPVVTPPKDDKCQAVETRHQRREREMEDKLDEVTRLQNKEIAPENEPVVEEGQKRRRQKKLWQDKTPSLASMDWNQIGKKEELLKAQEEDISLDRIRRFAAEYPESQRGKEETHFCLDGTMLCRKYYPHGSDPCDVGPVKQIVVPTCWRQAILSLAHDIPMAGHLGVKKTRQRILQHFYWPGVFHDVVEFCKSCPSCQKRVPRGRVAKVPLVSIPPMDVPFKRLALDIVGPLTRTKKGKKYILVVADYATKYPDAVALKNQEAETVAEALIEIISRVGVPTEILIDLGTNFVSGLMEELARLLQIRKLKTTPYHAQANGQVERFNGTLKQMLMKFPNDEADDWDRYLPFVLFAYREVPQSSTGFSPLELVYGRYVRGPLEILSESWQESPDADNSTLSYLLETRERLEKMTALAHANEENAKEKQKFYFDKKTRKRVLEPGLMALVLLPTATSKLQAEWKGPFSVVERVSPVDYKIELTNGHRKTFHINMLKRWHARENDTEVEESAQIVEQDESEWQDICMAVITETNRDEAGSLGDPLDILENPLLVASQTFEDVNYAETLSTVRKEELVQLCRKFPDVLTDLPGHTAVMVGKYL